MCGEQELHSAHAGVFSGSPPRVRGTAICVPFNQHLFRITPACAGNRFGLYHDLFAGKDHPRVCGEQHDLFAGNFNGLGSPPRVRGTVARRGNMGRGHRITPACAGNSEWYNEDKVIVTDHPRVCGEQSMWLWSMAKCADSETGSPPRVRGTDFSQARAVCIPGITPACAGNSRVF